MHWSDILGGFLLTRYRDMRAVLFDRRLSPDRITPFRDHLPPQRAETKDLLATLGMWAVFNDPPDHMRRRGLLGKAFTPRAVAALRPTIKASVGRLAGAAAERGAFRIADFACPLAATVIASMIGVPADDLGSRASASPRTRSSLPGSCCSSPAMRRRPTWPATAS